MPDLADILDRMTVRVTSPDKRVRAELRRRAVTVSFASPDAYGAYRDATALAGQVAATITSAVAAADRARRQLVAQHTGLRIDDEPHWDPGRRRLRERRDRIEVQGESPGGVVRITTVGLREWRVHVVAGTLQRLNSARFCAELNGAIADVHRAHAEAVYELKSAELGRVGAQPRGGA
ncbi:hypothetical protein AB0I28_28495 [Phytomonospora sp. NPDC050363]|uniref:hypothetical protein n=1 Tax=Phytomonospora sp. NPDC050363 TaxID=3155642 RepID=UPI0033DD0C93